MDDWDFLQAYALTGSESAFQGLVERYVSQVHSMAMREMGDSHRAQDVTQAVFLILARKAASLSRNTVLSGWLFQATRHVARTALRTERRRQAREMQAIQCSEADQDDELVSQVETHLNDAIEALGEADRNALLLRYFQQRSISDVAASLGTSEEAAQKRVERAVEKLRRYFGRRGVVVPAVAILSVFSAQAAQPVPPLLVQGISSLGVASAPAVSVAAVGLMEGAQRTMLLSKLLGPVLVSTVTILLLWSVAGHFGRSAPGSPLVFDLAKDFSGNSNPNGVWSYGWKSELSEEACTALEVRHTSFADGNVAIPSWQLTSGFTPAVYKNVTPDFISVGGGAASVPPETVWMIAGETGRPENFGVVRLTVPPGGSGRYRVELAVAPNYGGPPQGDTDFHLVLNGAELFGRFLSPAESAGFTNQLRLRDGDRLDFAIGRGADGSQYGSVLRIQARVERTKAEMQAGRP